jgi:5-(carboxyamino)imidazole ribonucleotide mutase
MVGVVMGSRSDWETMTHAAETLDSFAVPFEVRVLSAHRTPDALLEWASTAEARGLAVIIAAAGGAAHLAGVTAAKTTLPVLGVPMESAALRAWTRSCPPCRCPPASRWPPSPSAGPARTNAALFAVAILAGRDKRLRDASTVIRKEQSARCSRGAIPRGSAPDAGRRQA